MVAQKRAYFLAEQYYWRSFETYLLILIFTTRKVNPDKRGLYGCAALFDQVRNVVAGKPERREMLTGVHIVRPGKDRHRKIVG